MIALRPVDPSFANQLVTLWRTTFFEAYQGSLSDENIAAYCDATYTIEAANEFLSDSNVVCKVAFKEETPVGFYLIKHHDCPIPLEDGATEMKQIYVLSSEYGSGTGNLLFDDAIQCVQNINHKWMWLIVADFNKRAKSFYMKQNFESLGEGPILQIGKHPLASTIMACEV